MNPQDRFFETTRGKIVTALRGRHGASAYELAQEFGLSPNAIRQQLVILERDGLVSGHAVRRGKTKPTQEFSLTPDAERFFPQQYDKMLNAVLREVRASGGEAAVKSIFAAMGKRSSERVAERLGDKPLPERVIELTEILREAGVEAKLETTATGYVLHEHNCPYAKTVSEHPEVCSIIHTIFEQNVPAKTTQTESLATGGTECRFEIVS